RLQGVGRDGLHAVHDVGQDPEGDVSGADEHELVGVGDAAFGQVEELLEVDDSQDAPAYVDDAGHEGRRAGQGRQVVERVDLAHVGRLDGVPLVGEAEDDDVERGGIGLRVARLAGQGARPFEQDTPGLAAGVG